MINSPANIDEISNLLIEATEKFILPRYNALAKHEIQSKTTPTDLVTQADIDVEDFLEKALPKLHPKSLILGEEGISRGDHSLDLLQTPIDAPIWIIDPIDGTFNFVNGKEGFGVMLALIQNGETVCAWIYDVLKKTMTIASKGEGAFYGSERLDLSGSYNKPLDAMNIHVSSKYFPKEIEHTIRDNRAHFQSFMPIGSAAHEYVNIARGISEASVYSRLKPWDHLPGALIVEESGGYIAKWDGNAYTPQDDYAGLIVAKNKECWEYLYKVIFQDIDVSSYL